MKSFLKLLQSDLRQFTRDRTALFFTFAFPMLFMIVFGLVYSGNNGLSYDVGLVDADKSTVSAQITGVLSQVSIFKLNQVDNLDQELAKLKKGDIRAIIVIPAGTNADDVAGLIDAYVLEVEVFEKALEFERACLFVERGRGDFAEAGLEIEGAGLIALDGVQSGVDGGVVDQVGGGLRGQAEAERAGQHDDAAVHSDSLQRSGVSGAARQDRRRYQKRGGVA